MLRDEEFKSSVAVLLLRCLVASLSL